MSVTTSDYDQREAPGAPGQARRRRGRHQGGRCHRDRDEGEEAAHRGRPERHPRRCGRGHRRRRRHRSLSTSSPPWRLCSRPWRATRRPACSIVAKALEAPIRQIAANAGLDGSVILEKVRASGKNRLRLRRLQGGVLRHDLRRHHRPGQGDPLRSGERRLRRSSMVLTTESLVADKPEPPAPAPAAPDMGGMY